MEDEAYKNRKWYGNQNKKFIYYFTNYYKLRQ
jgi:hypothetical protein